MAEFPRAAEIPENLRYVSHLHVSHLYVSHLYVSHLNVSHLSDYISMWPISLGYIHWTLSLSLSLHSISLRSIALVFISLGQGLSQDFNMPDFKTTIPQFLLVPIQPLIYFKSLYQPLLIAYCVRKNIFHLIYDLKDGLSGRFLFIAPKKSKLKVLYRYLSKGGCFQEIVCPKDRQDGSWLISCFRFHLSGIYLFVGL